MQKEQTREELEDSIKRLERQIKVETKPSNLRFLKKAKRKNEQKLAMKILGKA